MQTREAPSAEQPGSTISRAELIEKFKYGIYKRHISSIGIALEVLEREQIKLMPAAGKTIDYKTENMVMEIALQVIESCCSLGKEEAAALK